MRIHFEYPFKTNDILILYTVSIKQSHLALPLNCIEHYNLNKTVFHGIAYFFKTCCLNCLDSPTSASARVSKLSSVPTFVLRMFAPGDRVFVKMKGLPLWPARV